MKRRSFTKTMLAAGAGIMASPSPVTASPASGPVVISTWNHGLAANEAAWKVLANFGRALDAVEQGVRVSESDPNVSSVGYGGWPDRE